MNASQRSSISISSHEGTNNTNEVVPEREHRPNHRKNRQAPKPPGQPSALTKTETDAKHLAETTTNLEIRAPSELLLGFPTGLRTQWRHSAEVLITSAVKYEVNVRDRHKHSSNGATFFKLFSLFFFSSVSGINGCERVTRH